MDFLWYSDIPLQFAIVWTPNFGEGWSSPESSCAIFNGDSSLAHNLPSSAGGAIRNSLSCQTFHFRANACESTCKRQGDASSILPENWSKTLFLSAIRHRNEESV